MSLPFPSKTSVYYSPQLLARMMTAEVLKKTGITDKTRRNWAKGLVRKVHTAYVRAVLEATKRG